MKVIPEIQQIGIIHTSFTSPKGMPIQSSFADETSTGIVEIFDSYVSGLKDLDGFERIWLIYYFNQIHKTELTVKPFLDSHQHGVYSTRAPVRPNHIGMSPVKLYSITGNRLEIGCIDVLDGTPLLDIKPYIPKFDSFTVNRAGWFDTVKNTAVTSDDRFNIK